MTIKLASFGYRFPEPGLSADKLFPAVLRQKRLTYVHRLSFSSLPHEKMPAFYLVRYFIPQALVEIPMPIPEIEFFPKSLDPPPITPMMRITKTRHVLAVPDLKRSADYYEQVLGFRIFEISDPGWRFAERDGCMLMLGECPDALPPTELGDHSYFAYFEVDNIDPLYKEFADKGANMRHPPADKPWGMREFPLQTIDGHRITFGQEL